MGLRIKEVCKEHSITLAEVAAKIGINPITLSQSLNGNPTMKRLEEVAGALNVDVSELFERPVENDIHGCIYVKGEPHLIKDKWALKRILAEIEKEG